LFPIKYVGLLLFIWVGMAFFGAIWEDCTMPLQPGDHSDIDTITNFGIVESQQSWGPIQIVSAPANFFTALYHILTFQFSFIYGTWVYVKWIFLGPIIATVVFGLIILTIQLFTRSL
jgi:hypothetical protein